MKTEIVKCYWDDGTYCVKFKDDKGNIANYNDMSGAKWRKSEFTKIEPLETGDTLQEVADWCVDNDESVCFLSTGPIIIGGVVEITDYKTSVDTTDLLEHIRKPKLKQITPEELAEMGYELVTNK